jgi:hypothetical protein
MPKMTFETSLALNNNIKVNSILGGTHAPPQGTLFGNHSFKRMVFLIYEKNLRKRKRYLNGIRIVAWPRYLPLCYLAVTVIG